MTAKRVLLIGLLLLFLGATARWWLSPLLGAIGTHTDLLQGIEALASLLGSAGMLAASVWAWVLSRRVSDGSTPEPSRVTAEGGSLAAETISNSEVQIGHRITVEAQPGEELSEEAKASAEARYRQFIIDKHKYLPLAGMGVADPSLRLPVREVWVPLQARNLGDPRADSSGNDSPSVLGGRPLDHSMEREVGVSVAILDLIEKNPGLVVIGDPGSGKTTLLKFLALTCAERAEEPQTLSGRLPVLVPVSAYAQSLEKHLESGDDLTLAKFIPECVARDCQEERSQAVVATALENGEGLVLLDGLDEVRELDHRRRVAGRVWDFFASFRQRGNVFVVTSRVVGYGDIRRATDGLAECLLLDFGDQEIENFAISWTSALERTVRGRNQAAQEAARQQRLALLSAVRSNPGVRRLAGNPLLLTMLVLMQRQKVQLPDERIRLYERYVECLLRDWGLARLLGDPDERAKAGPASSYDETVRRLASLAIWMHEVDPVYGLVPRGILEKRLESLYEKDGMRRFLGDVGSGAGLLVLRDEQHYSFIHLTFEEYLAAVGIADQAQGDSEALYKAIEGRVGDTAWREVILLLVAHVGLNQRLPRVAGELLCRLVDRQPGNAGEAVVLAGEALADGGSSVVLPEARERVTEALVETMESIEVPNPRRIAAGLVLGRLGWQPDDLDVFCEVPPGPFLYGDPPEERMIENRYWIARYPVTVAQFQAFIDAGGYDDDSLWSEDGRPWRDRGRANIPRRLPDRSANALQPRTGVTWYEAEAYAEWRSRQSGPLALASGDQLDAPEGYALRLPTEVQWERAARGTDGRTYPWENGFESAFANTKEGWAGGDEKRGPSPVCCFPHGRSPAGALDLAGNVWEWTSTPFETEKYNGFDLRGGSFYFSNSIARCSSRGGDVPELFYDDLGFRLVLSLAVSGS